MRPSPTLQAMAHQPGVEGVPVDSTLSVNFRASNSPSRETAPDRQCEFADGNGGHAGDRRPQALAFDLVSVSSPSKTGRLRGHLRAKASTEGGRHPVFSEANGPTPDDASPETAMQRKATLTSAHRKRAAIPS